MAAQTPYTKHLPRLGLSLLLVEPGEQRNLAKIHQTLARAGGGSIPAFPVEQARLAVVRDRVTAARRLDKMLLHNRWTREYTNFHLTISDKVLHQCTSKDFVFEGGSTLNF